MSTNNDQTPNQRFPPVIAAAVVRIPAIEGLRAWLAWTVVVYHLMNTMNFDAHYGLTAKADAFGSGAVVMFMLLSGFVITGLLLSRKEQWLSFITRRAFRLFPAYWLALGLGAAAMLIRPYVLADVSWASDPSFVADLASHRANLEAVQDAPWLQTLLHLTLLQGVPPPAFMPHVSDTILGPAWSLSVEWQFYLVAPILIWMARKQTRALILVFAAALLLFARHRGWQSEMMSPAALPNVLCIFVIGIFSRIALAFIPTQAGFGWAAAAAIVLIGMGFGLAPPIALWLAFVVLIARSPIAARQGARRSFLDRAFAAALESPIACYLGDRSYSVYVLHSPILVFAGAIVFPLFPFTRLEAFLAMLVVVVPVTLIASELMYRFVERPMIRLGARLAARIGPASGRDPIIISTHGDLREGGILA